ncbi:hypothetical protein KP509_12G014900 [Ceratopteris richardii]|uniref:Uncharacterized protein n=1 Tax=Ceratopteris richardii TaxID=49495 RepID=A0A8T2TGS7_CERRI|nr:hypothetical protein KP509_12G014900 [Ceratopteris richardii]
MGECEHKLSFDSFNACASCVLRLLSLLYPVASVSPSFNDHFPYTKIAPKAILEEGLPVLQRNPLLLTIFPTTLPPILWGYRCTRSRSLGFVRSERYRP